MESVHERAVCCCVLAASALRHLGQPNIPRYNRVIKATRKNSCVSVLNAYPSTSLMVRPRIGGYMNAHCACVKSAPAPTKPVCRCASVPVSSNRHHWIVVFFLERMLTRAAARTSPGQKTHNFGTMRARRDPRYKPFTIKYYTVSMGDSQLRCRKSYALPASVCVWKQRVEYVSNAYLFRCRRRLFKLKLMQTIRTA